MELASSNRLRFSLNTVIIVVVVVAAAARYTNIFLLNRAEQEG
jgi:hypothetical protein